MFAPLGASHKKYPYFRTPGLDPSPPNLPSCGQRAPPPPPKKKKKNGEKQALRSETFRLRIRHGAAQGAPHFLKIRRPREAGGRAGVNLLSPTLDFQLAEFVHFCDLSWLS